MARRGTYYELVLNQAASSPDLAGSPIDGGAAGARA
jgi:hypothetical protein